MKSSFLKSVSLTVLGVVIAALPSSAFGAVLVADVNLANVVSTEKAGVINGQFDLQANMGQQNDIVYGVEVRDKNNAVEDVQKLGEEASLQQGESKHYTFAYTIPAALQGEVSILLFVETTGGLNIGAYELMHKTYPSAAAAFSCAPTAAPIVCTASAATSLTASYVRGSLFSAPVATESKAVLMDGKTTFAPTLAPGSYTALITDTAHTQTVAVPFFVQGNFGSIQNVAVTGAADGTLAVTVLATASSASSTLSVALTGTDHSSCGDKTVPLTGNLFTLSFPSSCKEGTIAVTILDANNAVLATSATPFSVLAVGTGASQTGQGSKTTLLFAAILLLLIMVGAAAFFYLRKKPVVPPMAMLLLLVAATLLGGAEHASAATYAIGGTMQYQPCTKGDSPGGSSWTNGNTGCANPGSWYNAYTTSGTVTVPDSVFADSSYTISITQSVSFPGHTTDCVYSNYTAPCGSTNVSTDMYRNLPAPTGVPPTNLYNTLGPGPGGNPIPTTAVYIGGINYTSSSGIISLTAPTSGTSDVLAFIQMPAAQVGAGCVGAKKGCWTYFKSYDSIAIPIKYDCIVNNFRPGTYLDNGTTKALRIGQSTYVRMTAGWSYTCDNSPSAVCVDTGPANSSGDTISCVAASPYCQINGVNNFQTYTTDPFYVGQTGAIEGPLLPTPSSKFSWFCIGYLGASCSPADYASWNAAGRPRTIACVGPGMPATTPTVRIQFN